MKKVLVRILLLSVLTGTELMPAYAAERGSEAKESMTVTSYAEAMAAPMEASGLTGAASVIHHLSVTGNYGYVAGCGLTGTCYATLTGSRTAASYSIVNTFNVSGGGYHVGAPLTGSSTSGADYTWNQDDGSPVKFSSTSTTATCMKSGYATVDITRETYNPYS